MIQPAVYILTNKYHGTLYVGVTSSLVQRVYQHKNGLIPGFAHKYGCKYLMYFEMHSTMEHAIMREKQLKAGTRNMKIKLIESINPEWKDLYDSLLG